MIQGFRWLLGQPPEALDHGSRAEPQQLKTAMSARAQFGQQHAVHKLGRWRAVHKLGRQLAAHC